MPEARFTGDDDAFAALVLRFLDGATSPEEDALLNAELGDPRNEARRELYVSLCRQRGLLSETMASKRGAGSRRKLWVAAAAAILVGIVGIFFLSREGQEPIVVVDRAQGKVVRSDGSAIVAGERLFAGEGVGTNGQGRAVLRFNDGTRVELAAQTQISGLAAEEGKKLFVARGTVLADVAKQPPGRPMAIRTPEGEATIIGTKFAIEVKSGSTRLEVEKGLVRLTRLADRKFADVAAGQYAVAAANEDPVARSVAPAGAALIRSMTPNSWRSVSGTALTKVAPDKAKFPGIQGRMGVEGVVSAWSGGAFDTKRNRLVLWGGGHTDYHGNEVYGFNVDTMVWERITEPTPNPKLNDEVNGDGTPNSRATYNGLAYMAHADRLFAFGGSVAGNGFAACRITWALDFDTRTWTNRAPAGANPPPDLGCTCAYDPLTRKIWWGENSGLYSYDYDGNRWAKHNEDPFYYYTSVVDTKRGLWVVVGNGRVFAYDIHGGSPARQTWNTTGGDELIRKSNPGLDYDPVRDRIVGWAGGAVYALDPETKAWAAFDVPGAPAPTPNGIYGRWRYVPSVDAFIAVTAAGEDVRFYKPGR